MKRGYSRMVPVTAHRSRTFPDTWGLSPEIPTSTSANAETQPFFTNYTCGLCLLTSSRQSAEGEGTDYMMASKSDAMRQLGYKRNDSHDILLSQAVIMLKARTQ